MAKQALAFSVLALSALIALAGCTNQADAPANPPSATFDPGPDFTTPITAAWNVDVDLVGVPAVAEGLVVSYVSGPEGGLAIVAWNASTGKELWRDTALAGNGISDDLNAQIIETEGRIVVPYFRDLPDDDGLYQQVVVADAATGVPVALDQAAAWVLKRPAACVDGNDVCFSGVPVGVAFDGSGKDTRTFRIDIATGMVSLDQDIVIPPNSRLLSDRVFDTNDRAPEGVEMLGYLEAGISVWTVPYTDIFGGNYTSDNGWAWRDITADKLLIGMGMEWDPAIDTEKDYSFDRADRQTVALNRADGSVAWRLDGVGECTASPFDSAFAGDVFPACRVNSGVVHVTRAADGSVADLVYDGVHVDLVGVNKNTGDVEWSSPIGGDRMLFNWQVVGFESNTNIRLISVNGQAKVFDVLTGRESSAPVDGIFACRKTRPDVELPPYAGGAEAYYAGDNVFPCDINTESLDASVFSPEGLLMAGHAAGDGYYVVGGASGLSGFLLPAAD